MGFLSYHLNYYCDALERLESGTAEEGSVYHARQLLKLLDDLADEGYYTLNDTLEERFQGVARLRTYLEKNHAVPFPSAPFPRESAMALRMRGVGAVRCAPKCRRSSRNDFEGLAGALS